MGKFCKDCNRPLDGPRWKHVCDMVLLSNGRIVHADRVDDYEGDIRKRIDAGEVKVVNRFIKRDDKN